MQSLKELIDERNKAVADAQAVIDRAEREKRALSKEEDEQTDRAFAECDRLQKLIDARKAAPGRQTAPSVLGGAKNTESLKINLRGKEIEYKPGTPEHSRGTEAYLAAFCHYIRTGRESLALTVGKNTKGGYLAPTQMAADLIKFLDNAVFMRQLCRVETLGSAVSLGVPSFDTDYTTADWTAEITASDLSEDDTAAFGKREFVPHQLTKLALWSKALIRAVPSLTSFVTERLGYQFAITEETAFMTGTGAQQPLGIFVASTDGITTARDVTASATTSFTGDDLWNMFFTIKQQYQNNATWVVSRPFIKMARKLKDGNSNYIWQPGLNGVPGTLCDRPYVMSEYASQTFTTGLYVAVLGDFKTGYWIADSMDQEYEDVSILFTLKGKGGVKATKWTDGAPVLAEAFARLKLA